MEELKKYGNLTTDYPLSQLTICIGFFFVYFLEEFTHWFISRLPSEPVGIRKRMNSSKSSVSPAEFIPEKRNSNASIIDDEYEHNESSDDEKRDFKQEDQNSLKKVLSIDENLENIVYDSLSLNSEVMRQNAKNLELNKEEQNKEEAIACEIKSQQQMMRCLIMILALSLHAIFEGLSIGLQNQTSSIWFLFVAVSIHSATILACMGLELLLARVRTRNICLQMLVLALVSPFGVVLGLLITLSSNLETRAKSTAIVLLEGLSAGTILYITFFEVLNREKERRTCRLYRSLCIIGGFSLMALLQCLEKYSLS